MSASDADGISLVSYVNGRTFKYHSHTLGLQ